MAQPGLYIYRQNPLLSRSFLILRKDRHGDAVPVGDYTVLDWNEDSSLSEKKVMNLVSLLNGNEGMNLSEAVDGRLLFHCKPKPEGSIGQEIVFYNYKGNGVSHENAILSLQEEIAS